MRRQRDWFWRIKAIGQGPDYVFIATFAQANAENLAKLVQRHLPHGHVYEEDSVNHQYKCERYASYIDTYTHKRLMDMRENGKRENFYYYGEITVCDHNLTIQHVLSGGAYGGTDLILALAQSTELTLHEWKVAYNGYSWGEVAKGTTSEELIDYLYWQELPDQKPDFEKIETELRAVLMRPEFSEVLELGEFRVGEWMCQALLLFKIRQRPDYDAIIKTVTSKCQVPGFKVYDLGSYPAPKDSPFMDLGQYVQFGYCYDSGYDYEDEFTEQRRQNYKDR